MKPLVTKLAFMLCALIILNLFASCTQKTASTPTGGDTIKIGVYYPLTGETATYGQSGKKGVEMAQEQINAAGGLLGKKVEIIYEDDRGLQQEATTAVEKLIERDKVVGIIGEAVSTNSIAGGHICQEKGIPMITPSSTNPQVTEVGDYIFRVCFLDSFQGDVMARFAINNLKIKRVAILQDNSNDYSLGLAQFFTEAFKKYGGEIVINASYQKSDVDFSAQLTKIGALKPEAIYVPGYYTQVGQIAQQARKAGITVPLLGGDGWDSPSLIEIGKEAMNNCYFSNHYSNQDPDPKIQSFVKAFQEKYKIDPDTTAGLAYDSAQILFQGIKSANSTNGAAIRDEILKTKDYAGITGVISFITTRDAVKSAVIIGIEQGKYVIKDKLSPITATK